MPNMLNMVSNMLKLQTYKTAVKFILTFWKR